MFLTGILTVVSLLMIASAASSRESKPLVMIGGIALFVASLTGHYFSYSGLIPAVTAVSVELGIGMILMAGFLSRKGRSSRPFFVLGSLALLVSVIFLGFQKLSIGSDSTLNPAVSSDEQQTFLVELGPDDSIEELHPVLDRFGARSERAFPRISLGMDEDLAQVYLVTVPSEKSTLLIHALEFDKENVDHIEVNRSIGLDEPLEVRETNHRSGSVLEDDPLVSQQWALDAIRGHQAHALLKDLTPERKAIIAIVDTGVDGRHEDIRSAFTNSPGKTDRHGHGSHCAGIAGAVTNNGVGIASLNWEGRFIEITGYQALNDQGFGTVESIAQAILDAAREDADVISMSLGDRSETPPKTIVDAVEFAQRRGAVVVVSAGNSNEDAKLHMPSNIDGVIVVSAIDENEHKATFSNTNTSLARPITAPGVDILSIKAGGDYVRMSGTSMSTPVVSGLVGILRSLKPNLTADEIYKILEETGKTVTDSGSIGKLIDAEAAIKAALSAS